MKKTKRRHKVVTPLEPELPFEVNEIVELRRGQYIVQAVNSRRVVFVPATPANLQKRSLT